MKSQFRVLFVFFLMFVLVSLACGGSAGAPSPVAVQPTKQEETAASTATNPPPVTNTAVAPAGKEYTHKSGAFSFTAPADWSMDEQDSSVTFTSPNKMSLIYANFTNTGYALDSTGFENFINGNEQNNYSYLTNYKEMERKGDPASGEVNVTKQFDQDGKTQVVTSYYTQKGKIIYVLEVMTGIDVPQEEYVTEMDTASNTLKFNEAAVEQFDVYNFVYTFTSSSNLFSFEVPTPWIYSYESGDSIVIETFSAPDNNAFIPSIVYNDGSQQTAAIAGKATLMLLNNYYTNGSGDIKVSEDKIMPDKSERLTWESKKGNYSGLTFFEVRDGKTILILSTVSHNDLLDLYGPIFDYTLGSYANQ